MNQDLQQPTAIQLRKWVESAPFNNCVVAVIMLNAVLLGLGTSLTDPTWLRAIAVIETICVGFFVVEIVSAAWSTCPC